MTQILMRAWLAAQSVDLRERLQREEGQTIVEYALILGVIVAAGVAIFATMGGQIKSILTTVSGSL